MTKKFNTSQAMSLPVDVKAELAFMFSDESSDALFGVALERVKIAYANDTGKVTRAEVLDADPDAPKFSTDDSFCNWLAPYMRQLGYKQHASIRRFYPMGSRRGK